LEHRIEFGGDPQDVTISTSGDADVAGFRRMNSDLIADSRFRRGMKILVDHTDLDTSALPASDVRAIADSVAQLEEGFEGSFIAIVAPRALTFGLARMSVLMADLPSTRIGTFGVRENAVDWLRAQSPEADDGA
jgi:hypothetical protein